MRRSIIRIIFPLIFISSSLFAQEWSKKNEVEIKMLRSAENYEYLAEAKEKNTWESIKYIRLAKSQNTFPYLSLGANVRSEFQIILNEDWDPEADDLGVLFQRIMIHSDWHFSPEFRLFVQLKNGFTLGRNGPKRSIDNDDLDVHQAFVQWKKNQWRIEIGRQELMYGSRRLISIREGTNIRQSFDGGRIIWQQGRHRIDGLFFAYNQQETGVFDNPIHFDRLLWGAYYVSNAIGKTASNLDIYYLGAYQESSAFERGDQEETRHSFGIRHWGNWKRFTFNSEIISQFGNFGDQQILAWSLSTDLSFSIIDRKTFNYKTGLKIDWISGDESESDNQLNTFNALYPRGGYFGLLAIIGPANLIDIHPSMDFGFGKKWSFTVDWDIFWRHQLSDGIYFPSGRLQLESGGSDKRFIGHQGGVELVYEVNSFFEVETSWFYFFTGDFLNDVSPAANVNQFGLSLQFKI